MAASLGVVVDQGPAAAAEAQDIGAGAGVREGRIPHRRPGRAVVTQLADHQPLRGAAVVAHVGGEGAVAFPDDAGLHRAVADQRKAAGPRLS